MGDLLRFIDVRNLLGDKNCLKKNKKATGGSSLSAPTRGMCTAEE